MTHQRIDYEIIANLIEPRSTVLDLGCGQGELLELLVSQKQVMGIGIERDLEMVKKSLARGIAVIQRNIDEGLSNYEDHRFDVVVLSLTLQALKYPHVVLKEMLRIGKKVIVSFPNFGHISVRLDLLRRGKMPKNDFLPYQWYDTPNIHFCSIADFEDFCKQENFKIIQRVYLKNMKKAIKPCFPNLFALFSIFVLETKS